MHTPDDSLNSDNQDSTPEPSNLSPSLAAPQSGESGSSLPSLPSVKSPSSKGSAPGGVSGPFVLAQGPGESDPSSPSSPSVKSPTAKHRPKGKIARLPKNLRDQINTMIRDGVPYPAIIDQLDLSTLPNPISEQNLSNWKNAGHQRWLHEQEWREDIEEARDDALKFPGADDDAKLEQVTLKMASMRLYQLFKHLEPAAFAATAHEKPESYARLFSALPRITRESLRYQKYRDACAKARLALQTLRDPKRKLNEQERRSLVLLVDNILGLPSEDDPPTDPQTDASEPIPPESTAIETDATRS